MLNRTTLVPLLLASTALAGTPPPADEKPTNYFPGFERPAFPEGAIEGPAAGKPIIYIVVDALRPNNLSTYGYSRDTSPVLSKLADEGVVFTRYIANAPWTKAATTSMLTGLITAEHRTQGHNDKLPTDVGTFAQQLKKVGYTTLAVVGNGNASSAFGLNKGFDVYEDTVKNWKGLPKAEEVFRMGLELLKQHKGKKKVFLFLFTLDPHVPYLAWPPYDTMYVEKRDRDAKLIDKPHWEYKNNYPKPQWRKMVATYDGLIRYTDDELGKLIAGIKELGFYDDATIMFTADHGESFGEHGIYRHGHHHYETHLRIPLVIRAPWIKPEARGTHSSALLQQIDLFPTFAELTGARYPKSLDGVSMLDALRDRAKVPVPRYVISEYACYGIHRAAIRTRQYKLIFQMPADEAMFMKHVKKKELLPSVSFDKEVFHLFNVLTDPKELTNVWAQHKDGVGARLLKILKREIRVDGESVKAGDLDPALIEELRSMGYVQ